MGDAGLLLADAHVHVYECFDRRSFLDAAYDNFRAEARRRTGRGEFVGLLLLTETADCHWFRRWADGDPEAGIAGWTLEETAEPCSLRARSSVGGELGLIAGHQLVTAERLEVLALGTALRPPDGLPLAETLGAVRDLGAIPVVPWGAGKWLGSRGAALSRLLDRAEASHLFLGDNGGRLEIWRRPRHLRVAELRGIRILPGSDPLPFPSHVGRAGSFGFAASASISTTHPSRDLKRLLSDPGFEPQPYGSLAAPLPFVRDQLAMQLRSRLGVR